MDLLFILPACTVFLLLMGLYKSFVEKQVKAKEYIHELLGADEAAKRAVIAPEEQILKRRNKDEKSFLYKLEIQVERANLQMQASEFLILCFASMAIGYFLLMLGFKLNPFVSLVGGLAGFFAPQLYLKIRIFLRMKKAVEQFADVLDTLVNCFKTGYGFSRATQVIGENYEDPWGTEFTKMSVEINLGSTQEDALFSLRNRVPFPDMDLFVTALLIQKETGGNLSELMGNLSKTCRERQKLLRKVSAISAQGKLSASIVICIPFLLMLMMYMFLPGPSIEFLTNPIGIILMSLAGIWMLFGIGVLFKIVQLEV